MVVEGLVVNHLLEDLFGRLEVVETPIERLSADRLVLRVVKIFKKSEKKFFGQRKVNRINKRRVDPLFVLWTKLIALLESHFLPSKYG